MGINRIGRNHHTSMDSYVHNNKADYFIKRVSSYIDNKENSVIVYARIRYGLCHHIDNIDYALKEHIYWGYTDDYENHLLSSEKSRKLKALRKELSRALNKLDKYMQNKIGGN